MEREFNNNRSDSGFRKKKRTKKKMSFRKKRPPADLTFNYRDLNSYLPFITEEGKLVAARVSGLSAKQQRDLTLAVKRARHLAFISAVNKNIIS
jgi:small subunit ribosomal protein S18